MSVQTCKCCGVVFDDGLEGVTSKHLYKSGENGGYWFYYTQCPLCRYKFADGFHSSTHTYGWEFKEEAKKEGIEVENEY